jgi:hypothetical protein
MFLDTRLKPDSGRVFLEKPPCFRVCDDSSTGSKDSSRRAAQKTPEGFHFKAAIVLLAVESKNLREGEASLRLNQAIEFKELEVKTRRQAFADCALASPTNTEQSDKRTLPVAYLMRPLSFGEQSTGGFSQCLGDTHQAQNRDIRAARLQFGYKPRR